MAGKARSGAAVRVATQEEAEKRKKHKKSRRADNLLSCEDGTDLKPNRKEKKRKSTEDSNATTVAQEVHCMRANVECRKKEERANVAYGDLNACAGEKYCIKKREKAHCMRAHDECRTKEKRAKVVHTDLHACAEEKQELCYQNKLGIKRSKKENEKKKNKKKRAIYFEYQSLLRANQSCGGDAVVEQHVSTSKNKDGEIFGKRFTLEEDEILKTAILDFIKEKGWEEKEGIAKVLNSNRHREAYQCWREIKSWLPHRPQASIRHRAHRLLEDGAHLGSWSPEEVEVLRRLVGEHGKKWKNISTLMQRSQDAIFEKWRGLRRPWRTGPWTRDELQHLYELVHTDLRSKIAKQRKEDCNVLRDNISWDKIADAIGTRRHSSCCLKWYCNFSSTMVNDGLWATGDDFLLIESLLKSEACTEEEVEWDSLISHRSGQTCLIRWKQMVKHLGEIRTRGFLENLDGLVQRYTPDLLCAA